MQVERPTHPHPHPRPAASQARGLAYDVLVVGAGHAGIEAALAAARLGARTALVTLRLDKIGEMSCNPSIGGLGKGQLVREVDALGGAMGLAADATGIQFKMLGTGKGAAAQGPRCQSDRHLYREDVSARVRRHPCLDLAQGAACDLLVEAGERPPRVRGIRLEDGREIGALAVVITTGTFLQAVMHTGERQTAGGRAGEGGARGAGLSGALLRLGIELGRLKTGTPPRLAREGIDWAALEPQRGDPEPAPFSFSTPRASFPALPQVDCHLTWTNERTHAIVRANLHRAPMYAGRIRGVGPRYCPSVEDKVVRFADKGRHPVVLEPESLSTDVIYVNGVSTSLPGEVQEELVRTIPGLERARFLRHGYAVEYDFALPSQLDRTLAVRSVAGLYHAGQINGTSGYEEAAAQGLVAGANAALWASARAPFVLGRHEAYVGVLVDDLVVSQPTEPYRMFTSRAEYRLLMRSDNADRRLVRRGFEVGLAGREALERVERRERRLTRGRDLLASLRERAEPHKTLLEALRRPQASLGSLEAEHPELAALELEADERAALEIDVKYAGYVAREEEAVQRMRREEGVEIPGDLDYAAVRGLANEARARLSKLRPRTLGAAGRIAGVRPPDVGLVAIHVERMRRARVLSSKCASISRTGHGEAEWPVSPGSRERGAPP